MDPAACTSRGAKLFDRFQRKGDLNALDEAVRLFRAALSAVDEDHPMYRRCLSNLYAAGSALAEETGDPDTLQEAVRAGLIVLKLIGERVPEFPQYASEVGLSLQTLFERTGVVSTLRMSAKLAAAAVAASWEGGTVRAGRLANLNIVLELLYEHTGDAQAISQAITAGRAAVDAMPTRDPNRATCLSNLANTLRVAVTATGDLALLREAVAVGRKALRATPKRGPERARSMSSLAGALLTLYENTGDYDALEEAVTVGRAASAALPAGHPVQQVVLANLGISLRELFEDTGDADLLEEAVAAHRRVEAATPDGHPSQASRLMNLGNTLRVLYNHSGDPQDLHDAVAAGRRAVAVLPDDHPRRAAALSNLAITLVALADETDDVQIVGEAVSISRTALATLRADHPWHARFQSNLGISLCMLYRQTGALNTLREAVEAGRAAVTGASDGHPELADYLTGLGATLTTVFTTSAYPPTVSVARDALGDIAATSIDQRAGLLADLAEDLRARYAWTQDSADLDAAIRANQMALAAAPPNHPIRSAILANLELAKRARTDKPGSPSDAAAPEPDGRPGPAARADRLRQVRSRIDRFKATRAAEAVLTSDALGDVVDLLCSVPNPVEDIEVTQAAGWLLWIRFATRGTMDGQSELLVALDLFAPLYLRGDLLPGHVPDELVDVFEDKPPGKPDGAAVLAKLGRALLLESAEDTGVTTLNRSVDLLRRAVDLTGPDHHDYALYLSNLGSALDTRFDSTHVVADLEEAIELCQAAVETTRPDEPARATFLSNLGNALLSRAVYLTSEADLEAAIEAGQAAVTGWPDHPNHASMVANLDLALRARASYRDQVAGLDRMIESAREGSGEAGELGAAGLSDVLLTRFSRAGDPADLEEAIRVRRAAITAAADNSERAEHLSGLSDALRIRFLHFGEEQDLIGAVAYGRSAVATTSTGDPELAGRQVSLANALSRRYQSTGDLEDLVEAIALERSTVAATAPDEQNYPSYLSNLCLSLRMLGERTGRVADLDEAVEVGRAAAGAARRQTKQFPSCLGNLGAALLARFQHAHSQADLDEAVDTLRRASLAIPAAGPERATVLANLGGALQVQFDSTGRPDDLDEAIDACRQAVAATPLKHAARTTRLINLAGALQARAGIAGADLADLDEAIDAGWSAVEALAPGRPGRADALSNLALALRGRYELTGRSEDLDAAVDVARAAVAQIPADHPSRAGCLVNLGHALRERHARTGAAADLDGALAAAEEAVSDEVGPPRVRAVAAAQWANLAATGRQWADAVTAHVAVADLVARTVPRQLTRRDQEFLLDRMVDIAADAAACCVHAGSVTQAIELFEQSRGLLLGRALDSRTDLTTLAERYPESADRFAELCAELDTAPGGDAAARRATAAAFDQLVADIRELPGFDRFLHPPATRDLAPDQGHTVIVSVSRYGSNALILPAAGNPTAVPLPALTPEAVLTQATDFLTAIESADVGTALARAAAPDRMMRTLGWLWDTVAGPVLDALGITGPPRDGQPWPRLWWCPSGVLSFLPLHAAGHHDTAFDTVLDRVVSSVTPTLRALAHSRRAAGSPSRRRADRAVVVAMPTTPGRYTDLPAVETEVAVIERHFLGEVDVLTGTHATHDAVLAALTGAQWAHFACHGHSDLADPSAGQLVLADHHNRPLTVVDLARLRMNDAELAFLSACSTARPSGRLADEAIHLASAFQLAGYRHVIGTLWPIGDWPAVEVADQIYAAIADGAGIAEAVHSATRHLRDRCPDDPSVWASHIHVGP